MATATTTLSTTTIIVTIESSDTKIQLASLTGVTPGMLLYCDRELMRVVAPTGIGTGVSVLRGVSGTVTRRHGSSQAVYIGRPDQFYMTDPMGTPAPEPLVTPHINVINGVIWAVQGDDTGPGADARSWQPVTTTQTIGPLGVRVNTITSPA